MGYWPCDSGALPDARKLLIAGGFGAGKTTFVRAISEIRPLNTEEVLTTASLGVDDLTGVGDKTTTTVAVDFGRITFPNTPRDLVLYLFGMPGQDRFWLLWKELTINALGAVVIADTRRLDHSFHSVSFFEGYGIPFVVAVNEFDGADRYSPEEVRNALALPPPVPVVCCDARKTISARKVLITLLQYLLARGEAR